MIMAWSTPTSPTQPSMPNSLCKFWAIFWTIIAANSLKSSNLTSCSIRTMLALMWLGPQWNSSPEMGLNCWSMFHICQKLPQTTSGSCHEWRWSEQDAATALNRSLRLQWRGASGNSVRIRLQASSRGKAPAHKQKVCYVHPTLKIYLKKTFWGTLIWLTTVA